MKILYCHRLNEARAGQRCLATIDIELNDDIRMYGLRLLRMTDGKHFVFAPQSGQRRTATFSKTLSERLTDLALDAYGAANAAA